MFLKILCKAFCFLGLGSEGEAAGSGNPPILQRGKHFLILSFSGSSFRSQCKDKYTSPNTPTAISGQHPVANYSFLVPIPPTLLSLDTDIIGTQFFLISRK